MVVQYPSGAEGSFCSFLTVTPRLLFWCTGSVIPFLLPQLLLTAAISCGAIYLVNNDYLPSEDTEGMQQAHGSIGFLLSFLLVFKTQSAYKQFWAATDYVDGLLEDSRALAMSAVTMFKDTEGIDADQEARRLVRLIALHYFVTIEYFQRTGQNATANPAVQDSLRDDIRRLTGKNEFMMLYHEEDTEKIGSMSMNRCANPTVIHFWMQVSISNVLHAGACPPPICASLQQRLQNLMTHVMGMNKIDKTQFPLPYAQIVKLLNLVFIFSLPFLIVHGTGYLTPCVCVLVAIGFFGLDEVAEVLESPFGNDPNDIHLRRYGRKLMEDLSMMYHSREFQLDVVFANEDDFDLLQVSGAYSGALQTLQNNLSWKGRVGDTLTKVHSSPKMSSSSKPFGDPKRGMSARSLRRTASTPSVTSEMSDSVVARSQRLQQRLSRARSEGSEAGLKGSETGLEPLALSSGELQLGQRAATRSTLPAAAACRRSK
eukprot:TRINITY_DN11446_c0_g1_i1.p1 TRINITY_DN11446_c0_g1~~TRINITY_DN11446_c0_g1_i1.p1  ORF type:complete len:485 (-),score=109.05 TRINITY_DN11446_c0_g1_i1:373-1827(-)